MTAYPEISRFWEEAKRGVFAMQICRECGRWQHPPMPRCASCGSTLLEWRAVPGIGTVRSHTTASPRLMKLGDEPMVFVRVELHAQAGLVHVARLLGAAQVRCGLEVDVCFEQGLDGTLLPQFRPCNEARYTRP